MSVERKATCCCGQLSIRVEGEPTMVLACSCLACQRRTGSVLGVSSYFRDELVIEKTGNSTTYSRSGDSGLGGEACFCPNCGSTVYWSAEFMKNHTGIAVGCFADPDFPEPQVTIWNASKHKWVSYPNAWASSDTQDYK